MDELTIWSVVGLVAGIAWFVRGFKRLSLRRRIEGLATSRVRSMAMGTIELSGRARIETPLLDPIFQRPCAYFRIVVKEQRGSGKRSRWVTVYKKDSTGTPFMLEDPTGMARVNPAGAEVHFPPEIKETRGLRGFSDPAVAQFVSAVAGGGWNSKSVSAHILREGQPLFVVGFARPAENASIGVKASAHDAARLMKADPSAMKKADANNDGAIDQAEWDAAVARKREELGDAERARTIATAPTEALITVSRCPDGLFVIANTQDNLLSHLGWTSWLQIVGGPIATVASAFYLLTKWGSRL